MPGAQYDKLPESFGPLGFCFIQFPFQFRVVAIVEVFQLSLQKGDGAGKRIYFHRRVIVLHVQFIFTQIPVILQCHRKYSQSECRKAVVYSSVFHQTFPSISAIQRYHTQPSHRAPHRLCDATYFLLHGIK